VINGAEATDYDVVVVGSGIAGLSAALTAAERARVAVVTKGALGPRASNVDPHEGWHTLCHLRSDLPQASDQWHGDLVMHKDRGARFDRHL
jgi:succinate dehydrogenase/fumarate reductase flavoprotein subunit